METFKVEAKNKAGMDKKPRVYFTCHPDDLDKYFGRVCDDIFKTHDCTVYYTEDMTQTIAEDEKETDLGRSNLFVIPVTHKLLSTPNRAMDEDFPYARKVHIPVLPIMMESGLDRLYSRSDKFGELQYLKPNSADRTEISYEEKLKKYLDSVLISDELAKRVRAAFDAYIFLSYRKKDRKYANELMRLIHSIPEYRDIAIWFDEFLTPGESFRESIDKILHDSKLFTLLVTPNLLEEPDGTPNFVMGQEYPAARQADVEILPVEMRATDREALQEKFADIPPCLLPREDAFRERFLDAVRRLAITSNNTPEHNYLIGLAYLDGIDVEVNRERGIALITEAAEEGLPEAMKKLYTMYNQGLGTTVNYNKANKWAKRLANHSINHYGAYHPNALSAQNDLAESYKNIGDHISAAKVQERVHMGYRHTFGEEHPFTLTALSNLTLIYSDLGDCQKAATIQEEIYALRCRILGDEHPDTLLSLSNLSSFYSELGEYQKALEMKEKVYSLRCKILGEEHPDTIIAINNLAVSYSDLGEHQKALALKEKAYAASCRILGEEHPHTLTLLNNLAVSYSNLGEHQKALELEEKVYSLRCEILGEEHPDTLNLLSTLIGAYDELGLEQKALVLKEKLYRLRCEMLGEEHPDTITALYPLANHYSKLGDHRMMVEHSEKVYRYCCGKDGEESPGAVMALNSLVSSCRKQKDYPRAIQLGEKAYAQGCRIWGEENTTVLNTLFELAWNYSELGEHQKALELQKKVYGQYCKVCGEDHRLTIRALNNLACIYKILGDYQAALPLFEKLYAQRLALLGPEHPHTTKTLSRLEEVRENCKTV